MLVACKPTCRWISGVRATHVMKLRLEESFMEMVALNLSGPCSMRWVTRLTEWRQMIHYFMRDMSIEPVCVNGPGNESMSGIEKIHAGGQACSCRSIWLSDLAWNTKLLT